MATNRARSDDAKAARRHAIIDTALDVFDAAEFDAFTMDAVATKLGLAKGTLYRYFPTREALLLAVLHHDLLVWFDEVDAGLAAARSDRGAADALIDPLLARPRLMRLLSVLPTILEHNVPYETAREFKLFLLQRCATTGTAIERAVHARPGAGVRLLVQLNAGVIGFYHGAHPSPVVAMVLAETPFAPLRVDLRRELTHLARTLVRAIPTTSSKEDQAT